MIVSRGCYVIGVVAGRLKIRDHRVGRDLDSHPLSKPQNIALTPRWDDLSVPPALHRGDMPMVKASSYRGDATEFADYVAYIHERHIIGGLLDVNVDSVRELCNMPSMDETVGSKLNELRRRARLSLAEVAEVAGYAGPSSVQVYFGKKYDKPLQASVADRLAVAMANRGNPPVHRDEIYALIEAPSGEADDEQSPKLAPDNFTRAKKAPVTKGPGSGLMLTEAPIFAGEFGGVKEVSDSSGRAIRTEFTGVDLSSAGDVIKLPAWLDARRPFVVYMGENSMAPRIRLGEPVLTGRTRPPSAGDTVLVLLEPADDEQTLASCLIRILVQRTADFVELEQFNPPIIFRVPSQEVRSIRRVIPWQETYGL